MRAKERRLILECQEGFRDAAMWTSEMETGPRQLGAGNICSVSRVRDSVPRHSEMVFVGLLEFMCHFTLHCHDQASSRSPGCSSSSSPHAVRCIKHYLRSYQISTKLRLALGTFQWQLTMRSPFSHIVPATISDFDLCYYSKE